MVEEALTESGRVQSRIRALPSRVVAYLLLAACLFPELGYPRCGIGWWQGLAAWMWPPRPRAR